MVVDGPVYALQLEVVCEVKVAIESEPERPVAITAIMLPKSEQFAVIGTFNGYLRVFDVSERCSRVIWRAVIVGFPVGLQLSQRRIVQSVAAHDGSLLCATLSKSNHTILSGSGNGEVKVWQLSEDQYASDGNAVTDTPLRTITEHSAAVTALAVDAAAEVCYVGFADARLLVFDLLVGACIAVKVCAAGPLLTPHSVFVLLPALPMPQRDFEPECVKGDVFSGGVSGVSCGVTVTVRYNSNDCPAAVIGLADGRIAVVTVEGQVLGVLYSGEVLRWACCWLMRVAQNELTRLMCAAFLCGWR
jgi:WD40 repeat protein